MESSSTKPLRPVPNLFRKGRLVGGGPKRLVRLSDSQEDRPYELFELVPYGPLIGAEIRGVDLSRPLSDALIAEVNRALLEWKVLFFRDQDITSEQQRRFAERWGPLEEHPFLPGPADARDIVRFAKDAKVRGVENVWHADVTWQERPALGAVLRMINTPPYAGDTLWADAGAAYDNLRDSVKVRIAGLTALHDFSGTIGLDTPIAELRRLQEQHPIVEHPVVRTHPETGRKMLFVNAAFAMKIVGVADEESERLLQELFAQFHFPEFQVRLRWRSNTVAFWDNRAVQHYAVSDYYPQIRVAERVAIQGDRPF